MNAYKRVSDGYRKRAGEALPSEIGFSSGSGNEKSQTKKPYDDEYAEEQSEPDR
jgi:hypothetical protein